MIFPQNFGGRIKISISIFAIRFQVCAFCPFVPRINEYEVMIGIVTLYSHFTLSVQPSSVLSGGTESKCVSPSRFARLIVPARHNTRKVQKFFLTTAKRRM